MYGPMSQSPPLSVNATPQVLKQLEEFARKRGIKHSTIQICNPDYDGAPLLTADNV